MPKLMIVIASTRPGRVGLPVAEWFSGQASEHGGYEVGRVVAQFIDSQGVVQANDVMEQAARAMLDELGRWQAALRPLRVEVAQVN